VQEESHFFQVRGQARPHIMFLEGKVEFWNKMIEHPDYDDFWKRKNLLPHLHNIRCPVMLVTGWYDAEDLYGSFEVYRSVEEKNPGGLTELQPL